MLSVSNMQFDTSQHATPASTVFQPHSDLYLYHCPHRRVTMLLACGSGKPDILLLPCGSGELRRGWSRFCRGGGPIRSQGRPEGGCAAAPAAPPPLPKGLPCQVGTLAGRDITCCVLSHSLSRCSVCQAPALHQLPQLPKFIARALSYAAAPGLTA